MFDPLAPVAPPQPHHLPAHPTRPADQVNDPRRPAHVEPDTGTPVEIWDTDEPSERGIDGIERMRLVREDITRRVEQLAHQLQCQPTFGTNPTLTNGQAP